MLQKIATHVVRRAIQESQEEPAEKKQQQKKPLATCLINLDFIEDVLSKLFPFRNSPELSSRIRFKIQDLIDEYEKDWKQVIYGERKVVDEEGFQYKYVPKVAINKETEE